MRIAYLTRVDIGSNAAQARQIHSMARAFYAELGSEFLLMTSSSNDKEYLFPHQSIPFAKYTPLRYIGVCITAAARTLAKKDVAVFTRDIMVAAVVVTLGGRAIYEAHKEPKGRFAHYLMRILAKSERFRLVAISGALSDHYRDHFTIPDSRRLAAHDGVFPEDYTKLRNRSKAELRYELGLPLDKKIVVHTGSLYKGGAELFGVIVEARKGLLFVHVGGSHEECAQWETSYRDKGVVDILFISHKPIEQVMKYQVAADLLFYVTTKSNPIYWCTSPLKIFEYMAAGVPILASHIGSINEVLNHENSYGFSPDNKDSIKSSLESFFSDRHNSTKITMPALEDINREYSWHTRAKRILSLANSS